MTYIILAAGAGTRLHPITLRHPKTLFSLDRDTTIFSRMISLLRALDAEAEIIAVTGFQRDLIQRQVQGVTWVHNPFYAVTNSIASLWFARDFLDREATILNGDIVMSRDLMADVVTQRTQQPCVLMDSSILKNGDYNIQEDQGRVVVMSKALTGYSGEYAGVTKLDTASASRLREKVEELVASGIYDSWYEDALVQMIFEEHFELFIRDIASYEWTEVDNVDDLMHARSIHAKDAIRPGTKYTP